jgi:hypothetical protein
LQRYQILFSDIERRGAEPHFKADGEISVPLSRTYNNAHPSLGELKVALFLTREEVPNPWVLEKGEF